MSEPWILDMDATVKPLYGHQEKAVRGYNRTKPGRPSQVYRSYFIAAIRVVPEGKVQTGELYEYAVLVTSLEEEALGVAQLYRDRGGGRERTG